MVESRDVMLSIVSCVLAQLVGYTVLLIMFDFGDFLKNITLASLEEEVPEEVVKDILDFAEAIKASLYILIPISALLQGGVVGGVLGIFYSYLIRSKKVKPSISSILTGLLYIVALGLLPLLILSNYYPQLYVVLMEDLGLLPVIAPGIFYTIILSVLTVIRGPWVKWFESVPDKY